jgi:UDP-N-acetylglucosamine 1-carboxyvinyltransferase
MCRYKNVPKSPDVLKILDALKELGAAIRVDQEEGNVMDLSIRTSEQMKTDVSECLKEVQSAYLLVGPLLARFGRCTIPRPLGCQLGFRGYESHLNYLRSFNVTVEEIAGDRLLFSYKKKDLPLVAKGISSPRVIESFSDAAVTATENLLMFLSLYPETVRVSGIAEEPHVRDLIAFLGTMGASIGGNGNSRDISGMQKLRGGTYVAGPDYVEFFGSIVLALMTRSNLILHVPIRDLALHHMVHFARQYGAQIEVTDDGNGGENFQVNGSDYVWLPAPDFPKAGMREFKLTPRPWPGFPVDCLPAAIALSTMNRNPETSFMAINWMYENGLLYPQAMRHMGAHIPLLEDQRVLIMGTSGNPFTSSRRIVAPNVIEGVRALILCGLSAGEGIEIIIDNVDPIFRRNPGIVKQLQSLGADIELYEPDLITV